MAVTRNTQIDKKREHTGSSKAALLNQWAAAHWWSVKFVQEGLETFLTVTTFRFLAETFLENYPIFY